VLQMVKHQFRFVRVRMRVIPDRPSSVRSLVHLFVAGMGSLKKICSLRASLL
jgi:hypothetical protein